MLQANDTIIRKKYNLPLNERLKMLREEKGFTCSKTCKELERRGVKCAQATYQSYEADETSLNHRYPSLFMLLALADLFECSIDFLTGRSDKITGGKIAFKKHKTIFETVHLAN
jgi:transcriptional regulator with XRE-family HTH domain